MITASRILGDQVGSTAPVFLTFLAVHVLAGLTAVAAGATAALSRKGSTRHIRAGRLYYRAITTVLATATALAIMRWRQDFYLLIIGAIAFAAAATGVRHRRRHCPGDTVHITGMGISYVAMLTAFYVDNGPHLPLWDRLPSLSFWFLPAVVGTPLIIRAVIRARGDARPARTPAAPSRGLTIRGPLYVLEERKGVVPRGTTHDLMSDQPGQTSNGTLPERVREFLPGGRGEVQRSAVAVGGVADQDHAVAAGGLYASPAVAVAV